MAKKKSKHRQPPKLEPPEQNLWDILDDLGNAISMISVAKECLGYQNIAGDEYATLKTAIERLTSCHQRLDITAGIIAPSRKEKDGQDEEE